MNNSHEKIRFHSSRNLIVIRAIDDMSLAFQTMSEVNIRHLPVVDEDGVIVGMLSDRDIERAMQIDQADFFSGKTPQPGFDPNALVRDYMSWPVEAIGEDASIAEAAQTMLDKKISSLIVMQGGFAVGMITTDDLLKTLVTAHEEGWLGHLKTNVRSLAYNSPLGGVVQSLANSGV